MTDPTRPRSARLRSVDVLRGLVCVLMAIDHVRVYSGLPAGGPTPGIFFTRWVTHFVAPWFCLFAGVGAYFLGKKLESPGALARFLVTRGLLLVVLEVTLVRLTWTFSLDYSTFVLAGVIWMLGWCMVLLAAVVAQPARRVAGLGLAVVGFQQALAFVPRAVPEAARGGFGRVWEFVYPAGLRAAPPMEVLYVIVPWIGVMMLGYGLGLVLERDEAARRRWCLRVGVAATATYLLVAGVLVAVLPAGEGAPPVYIRMLNMQKYPASQLFLLMTIGPGLVLLPFAERARGRLAGALEVFGRVPLFYYLLHIPTIHAAGIVVMRLRGSFDPAWYATAPYTSVPRAEWWPLWLLYVVWALVVAGILYPACRWFAGVKAARPGGWIRYL